ncbi:hypothetical protein F511_23640 [Dorcoceras hygrometricum]|uniref:Uncharacterized protein n=1 Tax=Dorcoceras hygrometricum TaxID=472368 RepID=A0A2Z7BTJ4_9LAMI|nr:hypothetical protein F511_23640 [Dorcoceras hygrometricum]
MQNSSVLLVQADEGVSVLVVDRIGDIYRSLPRRADVIVTTVGARHKCQQAWASPYCCSVDIFNYTSLGVPLLFQFGYLLVFSRLARLHINLKPLAQAPPLGVSSGAPPSPFNPRDIVIVAQNIGPIEVRGPTLRSDLLRSDMIYDVLSCSTCSKMIYTSVLKGDKL